jgi:hypothetical protein
MFEEKQDSYQQQTMLDPKSKKSKSKSKTRFFYVENPGGCCRTIGWLILLGLTLSTLLVTVNLREDAKKWFKNNNNGNGNTNAVAVNIVLPTSSNVANIFTLSGDTGITLIPRRYTAGSAGYQGTNKEQIYVDDQTGFNPNADGKNFYFADDTGFIGNGWNITKGEKGTFLTLTAAPYNVTLPFTGDGTCPTCALGHVQALSYFNVPTEMPDEDIEIFYGGRYSCDIDTSNHPFGNQVNVEDDIRIAACGFNTASFPGFGETATNRMGVWTVADIFLSKGKKLGGSGKSFWVYGIYEILPFGKTNFGGPLGDYHAFTHAIPLVKVDSKDGFVDLAISYNRKRGTIKYWVEGQLAYTVDRVGFPLETKWMRILDHGGVDRLSFPKFVFRGKGIFTLLDAFKVNNKNFAKNNPLVQLDSEPSHYLDVFSPTDASPTFFDPLSKRSNRLYRQTTVFKVQYESAWKEDLSKQIDPNAPMEEPINQFENINFNNYA